MSRLKTRIVDLIEALGPMSVYEYMGRCLSDPEDGYYTTRNPFGRYGDFVTAPEVSQMFGELLGAWVAAAWFAMGRPQDVMVCEIGPGRGTLMKDVVRTLGSVAPDLHRAARFRLIETSARLREVQGETLRGAAACFEWHETMDDLPAHPMILLGNELFDAIPVRQYVRVQGVWRERMVDIDSYKNLRFIAGAGGVDLTLLPPDVANAPDGSIAEFAPGREALMQIVAERIVRHGGAALFFDYGYFEPGLGDTLQALLRHRYDDPLAHPGEADLTTHVDFGALLSVAHSAGLDTSTAAQGEFLLRLGLLERAGALGATASEEVRERLRSEVERLAGPDQMGSLFKVLAVTRRGVGVPGFDTATTRRT